MTSKHMTVVGACFMDYVSYVDRFPMAGETLHVNDFKKGFGGKGANQAVMMGKLGGRVRMVGLVGTDGDGEEYLKNFEREGIETKYVTKVEGESTGLAKILVDKTGENTIVICPNATKKVSVEHMKGLDWMEGTDMVVCQNEVPLDANLWALEQASKAGKQTVYIPAPAPTPEQLPKLLPVMQYVSVIAPNQHEASIMLGYTVNGIEEGKKAVLDLREKVLKNASSAVIITMGGDGCIVLEPNCTTAVHVPASKIPKEHIIDTTGAGDCFAGSFCYYLSTGCSLLDAVTKANVCAGVSVQRKGTQSSYPSAEEVAKL
eukprot:TRINITY_DN7536_c0_g1_i1.p1 TRINITY_DN7536_c0_g1~~TRINITY_DN7536_c0_g1_i1.p1  ORF type:complete len:317 (+),score=114.09 TRINITY_DN7536_c0_g1_i1:585-1535(+)